MTVDHERVDDGLWKVEHRLAAVLEVLSGAAAAEVAVRYGASKQSVYNWKSRYERAGQAGLHDRSRRPGTVRSGCRRRSSR